MKPPQVALFVVLLVSFTLAQNNTNGPPPVNGEPLISFDLGGVYTYQDLQKWPSDKFGITKGFARNGAGNILYGAMTNAVFRIDLTQPWGVSSSRKEKVLDPAFAAALVAIQYDEASNRIFVLATRPSPAIIILDGFPLPSFFLFHFISLHLLSFFLGLGSSVSFNYCYYYYYYTTLISLFISW